MEGFNALTALSWAEAPDKPPRRSLLLAPHPEMFDPSRLSLSNLCDVMTTLNKYWALVELP